ncbi:type 1 fimbria D-mannose specific adhesin FimH [Kosakonia sp. HypNH10]|uniref:type 1 fimbria D-mannose specific adhesin FimH n=1 Tax=Kosakonia sp. HypNH10 TaxID=2980101 RepID=UPI002446B6D9|nr:type 1 fimbria D-mannose specific adhesin FimH [Kosakonia sp. HypNH10]MDH2911819.1 type 1 fimbria D-mannose specific adhesin FimH [Kosakonia sp. HypNH10]
MRSIFAGVLWLAATQAFAASCYNAKGTPTDISYDLSDSFDSSSNQLNKVLTRSEKSAWIGVRAICPAGTRQTHTYRSYVTRFPVEFTAHGYRYLQISPHLQAAMRIHDSYAGEFYPPGNYIRMGREPNVAKQRPFGVMDSQLTLKLRVTERFMNRVTIPQQTLFTVYVTTGVNDPLITPVYTISLGGVVEVPQRCEVNAGQVVEFDFGDIRAALFSEAGAGNRPRGVTPQSRTVSISCTNVNAQANISVRLEAEKSDNHILLSDNPDLGFVVANESGQPFTPNNIFSVIPLQLDKNAAARFGIRAWPVSVTGNKPAEGPFSARGFLRVEYN